MTQLTDAVVLITGAAGGFGQELTRQLLVLGSRLILTDLDLEILKNTVSRIQQGVKTGEVLTCLEADLSSRQGCDRLYEEVRSLTQSLNINVDVLINNAGIGLYGRMDEVPADRWEQLMQVNLLAPMRLSAAFAAEMIARQRGHIVNISSIAGWISSPGLAHYSASKFGLRGFSEGLFNEVSPHNVQVTAVYPFFSRTPILHSPRYGSFAQGEGGVSEAQATDPADIMRVTIRAIQRNQLHVFPDRTANSLQVLRRLFPRLSNALIRALS